MSIRIASDGFLDGTGGSGHEGHIEHPHAQNGAHGVYRHIRRGRPLRDADVRTMSLSAAAAPHKRAAWAACPPRAATTAKPSNV